jgi:hypothetical protein
MLCAAQIAALLARLLVAAPPAAADSPAASFLAPYAGEEFPPTFAEALDALLRTEAAYDAGDYEQAATVLRDLWDRYPPGSDAWPGGLIQPAGLNIGSPPCYYGLRMYQDCVDWRLSLGGAQPPAPRAATLTVVLVGRTHGTQPRDRAELEAGTGAEARHSLDPLLRRDSNAAVHESLRLFAEWMLAMTGGRLNVRTRVVDLPDLDVPVSASARPYRLAGLGDGAMDQIWEALPPGTVASTDWWWVLYPSNVPEQYPDFTTTEFITGGMGRGPDGASPCFIIDDRWLVRKPPHLGSGSYTSVERRAYLPQWLQHEFMHHIFACYPEFGFEDRDHQWFDRATWPAEFEGRFEPDYYHEAMHKRILPLGDAPLHVALRYDAPPPELFREITLDRVLGDYRHRPVQNDWHEGTISREPEPGPDGQPVLRWTNRAGVSWRLTPDLASGLLLCEPGSPYYDSDPTNGRAFRLTLRRGASGAYVPELKGFQFGQGLYERQGE